MIDFTKELEQYDFMGIDKNAIDLANETDIIVASLNATLKRIAKEQSNTNMHMEEILKVLDEENEAQNQMNELEKSAKNTRKIHEDENRALVEGLISILDQFEAMYRYAIVYDGDDRSNQVRLLWESTLVSLMTCGIVRIDSQHVLMNPQLNIAVQTKHDEALPAGFILEVLKCGYIYNSNLLRKAQVIINAKKLEGGTYE